MYNLDKFTQKRIFGQKLQKSHIKNSFPVKNFRKIHSKNAFSVKNFTFQLFCQQFQTFC